MLDEAQANATATQAKPSEEKNKYSISSRAMPLSEENALASVLQILEHYDFEITDISDKPDKDGNIPREGVETAIAKVVKYFRRGIFEIDESKGKFEIIQHLQTSPGTLKEVRYQEFSGDTRVAADGKNPQKEVYGFSYKMLGSLSGLGDGIKKLQGSDLVAMEALGFLFFQLMS